MGLASAGLMNHTHRLRYLEVGDVPRGFGAAPTIVYLNATDPGVAALALRVIARANLWHASWAPYGGYRDCSTRSVRSIMAVISPATSQRTLCWQSATGNATRLLRNRSCAMAKSYPECEHLLYPLGRIYRDCLAAQSEWARSVDVIEQKVVLLIPLTGHSLQRDEKDIVIFTTSIDPESHPAPLRFPENPNLFNVATARARHELITVTSVWPDQLPAGLPRDFLNAAKSPCVPRLATDDLSSELEQQILERLLCRG